MKTPVKSVSKEALDILMGYHWKGNVRELENTIERAVILCDGDVITPDHFVLSKEVVSGPVTAFSSTEGTLESVAKEALRTAETKRISSALHETRGNKSKAAEILQVSYKTLLTKIKEYGIES
jgi:DNA-binding NtrC family response regulator